MSEEPQSIPPHLVPLGRAIIEFVDRKKAADAANLEFLGQMVLFQAGQVSNDVMASLVEDATMKLRAQIDAHRHVIALAADLDDPQFKAMSALDSETLDADEQRVVRMEKLLMALRHVRGEGGPT